jgi:hypothetical protein
MKLRLTSTILMLLVTASFPISVSGQPVKEASAARASVTLVVDASLSAESPVLVVRRTDIKPYNVIVVRGASISPNALAGALHSMRMQMIRDGIVPQQDMRSRPRFTSTESPSSVDPLLAELHRLSVAGVRNVAGFGNARSIDIEIPLADGRYMAGGLSRRTGLRTPPE